jgi:AcrR family transcriptional regulator
VANEVEPPLSTSTSNRLINQLVDTQRERRYRVHQVIDERPSARRHALVTAAYARLAAAGFEGLRTRDVAADVGVNIATLHYYFPTKEALIRAVIGHAIGRFQATMPGEGSAVDQLRGHLKALAHLLQTDAQLWAVMGELVLRAPRDENLAAIFRQTDDFWHRALADLIQRCIEEGTIDPELDASGTARLVIVAIKGMSLPTLAGSPEEIADQVFGQFERLFGLSELH